MENNCYFFKIKKHFLKSLNVLKGTMLFIPSTRLFSGGPNMLSLICSLLNKACTRECLTLLAHKCHIPAATVTLHLKKVGCVKHRSKYQRPEDGLFLTVAAVTMFCHWRGFLTFWPVGDGQVKIRNAIKSYALTNRQLW